jgi:sugar O-acyltransferase (sialic acid O-acetyltransferase NeuD family)
VTEQVVLVGCGGLSREVISTLAEVSDVRVLGLVDDDPARRGHRLLGVDVLGPLEAMTELPSTTEVVVCTGKGTVRAGLVLRLTALGVTDDRYRTVVHPSVTVPTSCTIGRGSIILAQVAMTAEVQVGSHVVVMPNSTFTHDDRIEDFATICAGVSLGGAVEVGRAAYLGMNASVRQEVRVGEEAVLGMGSVLLQDLPKGETWVGVPARPLARTSRSGSPSQTNTMRTTPGPELSRRESR